MKKFLSSLFSISIFSFLLITLSIFALGINSSSSDLGEDPIQSSDLETNIVYDFPSYVDVYKTDVNVSEPEAYDGTMRLKLYYPADANQNMIINVEVLDELYEPVENPDGTFMSDIATWSSIEGDDENNEKAVYQTEIFWVQSGSYHLRITLEGNDVGDDSFITPLITINEPSSTDISMENMSMELIKLNTENEDGSFDDDAEIQFKIDDYEDINNDAEYIEYVLYGSSSDVNDSNIILYNEPITPGSTELEHTFIGIEPDRYSGYINLYDADPDLPEANLIKSTSKLNQIYIESFKKTIVPGTPSLIIEDSEVMIVEDTINNTYDVIGNIHIQDDSDIMTNVSFSYESNDSRGIRDVEEGFIYAIESPPGSVEGVKEYDFVISDLSSSDDFNWTLDIAYYGGLIRESGETILVPADLTSTQILNLDSNITKETTSYPSTINNDGIISLIMQVESYKETFIDLKTISAMATNTFSGTEYEAEIEKIQSTLIEPGDETANLFEFYKLSFIGLPAGTYDISINFNFYGGTFESEQALTLEGVEIMEYEGEDLPIQDIQSSYELSNFEKNNGLIETQLTSINPNDVEFILEKFNETDSSWDFVESSSGSENGEIVTHEFINLEPNIYRVRVEFEQIEYYRNYYNIYDKEKRVPGKDHDDGATISYDYKITQSEQEVNPLDPNGELIDLETGTIHDISADVKDPDDNISDEHDVSFVLKLDNEEVGRTKALETSTDIWEPVIPEQDEYRYFDELSADTYQLIFEFTPEQGEYIASDTIDLIIVPEGNDPRSLSDGAILGILIGVTLFLGIIATGAGYYYVKIK